ncbi:DUF3168 domain-containing protein [Paracoccus aminophilus]|nr:DUF3168 domain-containing protein [Paracoccus aminophilus]
MDRMIAAVPDLGGRVFDQAGRVTPSPYVTLGPSHWASDDADCIDGRVLTLQIDVWGHGTTKGAMEDLTDDIAACLQGWSDIDAVTMHPVTVSMVRVMGDPDPDYVHGVLQIEVEIEA